MMYHFKCNVCRREFKCNKMVRYCIFCGSPTFYYLLIVNSEIKKYDAAVKMIEKPFYYLLIVNTALGLPPMWVEIPTFYYLLIVNLMAEVTGDTVSEGDFFLLSFDC